MAKYRIEDLIDYIDSNIQWRKKEIVTINVIKDKLKNHERDVFLRSGICIIYAHWEGFVKECSEEYIRYVQSSGYAIGSLTENFRAISLMGIISDLQATKKFYRSHEMLTKIEKMASDKVKMTNFNVDTMSNLNTEVFKDIAFCIGIDDSFYQLKSAIIDQKILGNRNPIAHGARRSIEEKDFKEVSEAVVLLLERFRDDLQNAAVNHNYMLSNSSNAI